MQKYDKRQTFRYKYEYQSQKKHTIQDINILTKNHFLGAFFPIKFL